MSKDMFNFKWEGFKEIYKLVDGTTKRTEEAIRKTLLANGFHLLNKAIELTPIDTGNLRGSGTVWVDDKVMATGKEEGGIIIKSKVIGEGDYIKQHYIEVTIGFNTMYAMKQHEDLSLKHADGEAKFLEKPLKKYKKMYHKKVREAIQKALDKGV